MKKLIAILSAAVLTLAACSPEADFTTRKVTISMNIDQVSAGFIHVTFTPNKQTYYLASVDKVVSGIDPFDYEEQFINLALDSAYVEYVTWRHSLLLKGEPYVADFPSHSLDYGEASVTQNFLEPDTDYWVYCFVVDPTSNKPVGDLFCQVVHTAKESVYNNVRFSYRVEGRWDYVYPYDCETGEIVSNVPWVAVSVDSTYLRDINVDAPKYYFECEFSGYDENSRILKGIYAHYNNGIGDGTTSTDFVEGHTYYTGIATFDGPMNDCFDIYKFRWAGDETELVLGDDYSVQDGWDIPGGNPEYDGEDEPEGAGDGEV